MDCGHSLSVLPVEDVLSLVTVLFLIHWLQHLLTEKSKRPRRRATLRFLSYLSFLLSRTLTAAHIVSDGVILVCLVKQALLTFFIIQGERSSTPSGGLTHNQAAFLIIYISA
ncbi:hypothetical protein TNCV_2417391 [Trichonephila clavipes]|nr:hypothetical protein TNCV_2417391 [Trichonephila clavipes]